jgi:hypothetical protein
VGELLPFRRLPEDAPRMFCCGCGKERTVPSSAADPGRCSCGSTARSSVQALVGAGATIRVTAAPGFLFEDGNDAA